jgi:hypothetical protein
MLTPLHQVVPYVLPFVISADGTREARPLIRGYLELIPNPYSGAKERHG